MAKSGCPHFESFNPFLDASCLQSREYNKDGILSIPFWMLRTKTLVLYPEQRLDFQSLFGCFYILATDAKKLNDIFFQSLFGCFRILYVNFDLSRFYLSIPFWMLPTFLVIICISQIIKTFNPFLDASREICKSCKSCEILIIKTFNPFLDASDFYT